MRILLVEDHPDTLRCLKTYLKSLGHSVTTATTMHAALEVIPTGDCDVLISDIGLPDGSGWELMEQAQFPQPVYAVAMSGFAAESDLSRSKAAGFRRHIIKPFGGEDIREVLKEAALEIKAGSQEMHAPNTARPPRKKPAAGQVPCLTPRQIADRLHHDTCQSLSAAHLLLTVARAQLPPEAAELRQQLTRIEGLLDESGAALSALMNELLSPTEKHPAAKIPPRHETSAG